MHDDELVLFEFGLYELMGQSEQLVEPGLEPYVPVGQTMQTPNSVT